MPPLEIERKFLARLTDELINECCQKIDIVQTYLIRSSEDIQRRVRSMTVDGKPSYYYTEKRFLSAGIREENEREISHEEYEKLLSEADSELTPIIKTRRILIYEGQRFEIDSYPFSDELCSVELELSDISQEIFFPPAAQIIKEVTGDSRYSNANLAKNGCFPE